MPRSARSTRRGCRGWVPTESWSPATRPTKEVPLHTALYQTRSAARAVVHLHSTHSVALSMLPEIDPRAALPPMTPYYLMKCGHTALVPYYRPGDPAVADAIKGLAGKYSSVLLANHGPVVSGDTLEAAVYAIEELEETAKLYLLLRGLNPRYLVAGTGEGFDEDVWTDAAGAWGAFVAIVCRTLSTSLRAQRSNPGAAEKLIASELTLLTTPTERSVETALRLHHGEPPQRNTLYRRDKQPAEAGF